MQSTLREGQVRGGKLRVVRLDLVIQNLLIYLQTISVEVGVCLYLQNQKSFRLNSMAVGLDNHLDPCQLYGYANIVDLELDLLEYQLLKRGRALHLDKCMYNQVEP